MSPMTVLISGCGIAGPTLAYWLVHAGARPVIVESSPQLRTGVGDAAFGPSLLAGEGSSLAMAGAYVLAGELAMDQKNPARAFEAYERRLRPLLHRKQAAARRLGSWFAPRTRLGLFSRNQLTKLASLPTPVAVW